MNWELHELNSLFELNVVPGRVPGTQVRDEYTMFDHNRDIRFLQKSFFTFTLKCAQMNQ